MGVSFRLGTGISRSAKKGGSKLKMELFLIKKVGQTFSELQALHSTYFFYQFGGGWLPNPSPRVLKNGGSENVTFFA